MSSYKYIYCNDCEKVLQGAKNIDQLWATLDCARYLVEIATLINMVNNKSRHIVFDHEFAYGYGDSRQDIDDILNLEKHLDHELVATYKVPANGGNAEGYMPEIVGVRDRGVQ